MGRFITWCSLGLLLFSGLPSLMAAAELRDEIDRHVEAAWKREGITPPPLSSDSEFLRRVYLDLVGEIPDIDMVKAFLDDKDTDKRQKLIDRLLDDPRYA